jgi:hypothetical protein
MPIRGHFYLSLPHQAPHLKNALHLWALTILKAWGENYDELKHT